MDLRGLYPYDWRPPGFEPREIGRKALEEVIYAPDDASGFLFLAKQLQAPIEKNAGQNIKIAALLKNSQIRMQNALPGGLVATLAAWAVLARVSYLLPSLLR